MGCVEIKNRKNKKENIAAERNKKNKECASLKNREFDDFGKTLSDIIDFSYCLVIHASF